MPAWKAADRQQDLLSELLANASGVRLGCLFGSRVVGITGPLSDVDVGVLLEDDSNPAEVLPSLAHEIATALETECMDVIALNEAALELAYAIISEGALLYERDLATRVEFEAYVLGRYRDYLPILRAQRNEILSGERDDRRIQRYAPALRRAERTLREIAATESPSPDGVRSESVG